MAKDFIYEVSSEIDRYQKTREFFKKQFWLQSKNLDAEQRKLIKKLFTKIDRLRNHLKLWLRHLVSNKPSNHESYVALIERGKSEINTSFKQLDEALYRK